MIKNISQVVLGSAQFGLNYGVSNITGRPQRSEVNEILYRGFELGIRELDTAPSYGDAESIIVEVMKDDYRINTKLLSCKYYNNELVIKSLEYSIKIFGRNLNSIAVHKVEDLCDENLMLIIESLRRSNKNIKIGVSIYNLEDLNIIDNSFNPDFIQLPFNIYDQRFKDNKLLSDFKLRGCEVHVRSVFLQGLLLMSISDVPLDLAPVISSHKKLIEYSRSHDMSIYKMCLSWVMNQDWVDKIVVGVNDIMQLELLVETINEIIREGYTSVDFSRFKINDPLIINPTNWK